MCEEEGKGHMMMGEESMMMKLLEMREEHMMKLFEKLGDSEKKALKLRILDAKIMNLKYMVETLEMIKTWIEKM